MTKFLSDHVPLLISIATSFPRPSIFRFELSWAVSLRSTVIATSWAAGPSNSNEAHGLVAALKKSRTALKTWRRSIASVKTKEANFKVVIALLDEIEESRFLSSQESALRALIIVLLHRTIREKVAYWKLHSKINTAIDGDENSKYFHTYASYLKRLNKIPLLLHNGHEFTQHAQKLDILSDFFKNLLGTPYNPIWHFDLANLYPTTVPQLSALDQPLSF